MADSKLTKSIGEHYVCAALAYEGWAASLTRDGLARTDILAVKATDAGERTLVEIQVKTTTTVSRPSWMLGDVKAPQGLREWYVLVAAGKRLRDGTRCFVLPRLHAQAASWIGHHTWLHDPNAKPGTRNTQIGQSRPYHVDFLGYEERWDLLDRPTDDVEVLLPQRMREDIDRPNVGLPPAHPWQQNRPGLERWPGPPAP